MGIAWHGLKWYETRKGTYQHWCPGCKGRHAIPTIETLENGAGPWGFNGDFLKPTFTPSIHIWHAAWVDTDLVGGVEVETHHPQKTICHYFIQEGVINFCGDSDHEFSGMQGVPIPDFPESILIPAREYGCLKE